MIMESSSKRRRSSNPSTYSSFTDFYSKGRRRMKTDLKVIDYSDPFAVPNLLEALAGGKYGTVTKDVAELAERRMQMLKPIYAENPSLACTYWDSRKSLSTEVSRLNELDHALALQNVIILEDDGAASPPRGLEINAPAGELPLVILDSDDEGTFDQKSAHLFQEIVLRKPGGEFLMKDFLDKICSKPQTMREKDSGKVKKDKRGHIGAEKDLAMEEGDKDKGNKEEGDKEEGDKDEGDKDVGDKDKGEYIGIEEDWEMEEGDNQTVMDYDGLADIWKEMTFALECSKETEDDLVLDDHVTDEEEDCDHSFVLKDDIGYVCRICGVIQKGIETIIEYQYPKGTRSTRTYSYESRAGKNKELPEILLDGDKVSGDFIATVEVSAHPRHRKQMKPHQIEGFNFLLRNLVTDNPGGCIMAHAPGSGKTFMIISFMQSFLAKYPHARPLVILPKGILSTWKKEFQRWQVEDLPLYDFYSVKADSRLQQLEVLKQWAGQKSILFLGYMQFSAIVSDHDTSKVACACQEMLLTYPSILILDEGHTPRNETTDIVNCLRKVQTPRKVILSGTLYQNHVKEVFNILDLVRPNFLHLDASRAIKRRIQSRLHKNSTKKFYELVEDALQEKENFKMKVAIIQDLREMTSKVLHYYKGDFLDELPGLVDFTVFLNLSPRQKKEACELKKSGGRKFKMNAEGCALYVHPELKDLPKNSACKDRVDEKKIDEMLEWIDIKEGVKAKFFYNLLCLCESASEKLLVFSQYLHPLKFLERLTVKLKCWRLGKEIFLITGDSSNEERDRSMELFNNSADARVLFGSIKACGEGISLVGASRVLILDVHLNPSITRQALGRAYRPGQLKKVYTYRLVAAESVEEEDYSTSFRKESIAKMWFEWNEFCGNNEFEIESVDVEECGDTFLETPLLSNDIKVLYRR